MDENEQYKLCLEIATEAHKGQKRNDGKDYITHPIVLASKFWANIPKSIAILHDVLEDTDLTAKDLLDKGVCKSIVRDVEILTRKPNQSYKDFIINIKEQRTVATEIKIVDLRHNLSDLKKGSLRDKYELALYILEDR